jgi:hypothetical protein
LHVKRLSTPPLAVFAPSCTIGDHEDWQWRSDGASGGASPGERIEVNGGKLFPNGSMRITVSVTRPGNAVTDVFRTARLIL